MRWVLDKETYDLLLRSVDELKEALVCIDARLRKLETAIAESDRSEKRTFDVKDMLVLICAAGAVIILSIFSAFW